MSRFDHAFNIGDTVYFEANDDRKWFVVGVVMRPSYDLICWEYYLARATYGDYPMSSFGCRCDVDRKGPVREEQLFTEEVRLAQIKEELEIKIRDAKKRLSELEQQKASI